MSRHTAVWGVLGAALSSLGVSVAHADDMSDLQGLLNQPVITTASQSAETATVAPATSTTITAEDLRRYGVHSLDEALDFLSLGVFTGNPGGTPDVGARGIVVPGDQGDHFLLLIDGHEMNEPLYGAARFGRGAAVPMEAIDHIEVVVGPGAVLYGSNAMLGVINIITKRAKDEPVHIVAESELGKSYRAGAGIGVPFGAGNEFSVQLEYYREVGYSSTYTVIPFTPNDISMQLIPFSISGANPGVWGGKATHATGAEVPTAMARLVLGAFEISAGASEFKRETPYDVLDFGGFTFFDDPAEYELDRHAWVDIKHHTSLSPVVKLSTRLYGDSFDYQRYADTSFPESCFFQNVQACRLHAASVSRWAGLEEQSAFDWLRDGRLVTLLGVDGRVRYVSAKTDTTDYDTGRHLESSYGVINETDAILGAYIQQTWAPARWFKLNAGARLDENPRFRPVSSPRAAAAFTVWKGGTLKGVYSSAFRTPSWNEIAGSSPTQIVSQNLVPETVRSIEGSFEQAFGAQRILFGVYGSQWNNLIELHPLTLSEVAAADRTGQLSLLNQSNVVQYRNVTSITSTGFNASFEGTAMTGAFSYGTTVTAASSHQQTATGTTNEAVAPAIFGNGHVAYHMPGDGPTLALAAHWMGPRSVQLLTDEPPVPQTPALLDLRATVSGRIPIPRLPGFSYRLSADYVTTTVAPYVVSPVQIGTSGYGLATIDRFRATLGLQYTWGGA